METENDINALEEQKAKLQYEVEQLNSDKEDLEAAMWFEAAVKQIPKIWDVNDQSTKQSSAYTKYKKEQIIGFLKSPTSNEKSLRDASIYMYDASSQYRRLIDYYAKLALICPVITSVSFDVTGSAKSVKGQFEKIAQRVQSMNLKHELGKALKTCYKEGVIYGVIWDNKDSSFFIQRINPDYCSLTSWEDGTWMYSVDMSKLTEKKLVLYPECFQRMWQDYKSSGQKWQEVPADVSFCLKSDESTSAHSAPPFSAVLPMLYDIETYKALQETATEISNYKLLSMLIPMNDSGKPKFSWKIAEKYFDQLCASLPPYVGAALSPMPITDHNFERSSGTSDVDAVGRAEEQFWFSTGTSALLHGSKTGDSAGTLKLAIKADEEIALSLITQSERIINRILKAGGGKSRFTIELLPVTQYNQQEVAGMYKDAATLGIPGAATRYAAAIGISQLDLVGMQTIEQDIINTENFKPLKSSFTSSKNDGAGRPTADDGDLSSSGERSRNNDVVDNR